MAANSPWWPGWRWRQDGLKGLRLRPSLLTKRDEGEPSLTVTAALNIFPGGRKAAWRCCSELWLGTQAEGIKFIRKSWRSSYIKLQLPLRTGCQMSGGGAVHLGEPTARLSASSQRASLTLAMFLPPESSWDGRSS